MNILCKVYFYTIGSKELIDLSIQGHTIHGGKPFISRGVNTDRTYFSIDHWHGADWQKKIPKMYASRKPKYETDGSTPVRWKGVPARFRDASETLTVK